MASSDDVSSPLPSPHSAAHERLDAAAMQATKLVQSFANVEDPYSESDGNPWNRPNQMFQQLCEARVELLGAWQEMEAGEKSTKPESSKLDPERCRALYMDMITDAFADTLENMRATEGDSLNVDVLVDCLQSGLEMLSTEEQEALFKLDHEFGGEGKKDAEEEELTAHESYRRKIGLDVSLSG